MNNNLYLMLYIYMYDLKKRGFKSANVFIKHYSAVFNIYIPHGSASIHIRYSSGSRVHPSLSSHISP